MKLRHRDAWNAALRTIDKLRAHGHSALLAGGCVRDRLLSITPKDYDVATDARPEQVQAVFRRARQVGAKFGVILVRQLGYEIEVATFRADGPYSDGRHPDDVRFGTEIEDAQRRDFTINGMFYDPAADRVIDHVGGQADLAARVLRTIGDPSRRFGEDHLRMLRAVRFAARLDFEIEVQTMQAIRELAPCLAGISAERIWQELEYILTAPARSTGWHLLVESGLNAHLARCWTAHRVGHENALIERRLAALPEDAVPPALALAAVLCDHRPQQTTDICKELRLSNRLSKSVVWLVAELPAIAEERSLDLADLKLLMADENWDSLLELLRVDRVAGEGDLAIHDRLRARAAAIAPESIAPAPLLNGDDLAGLGVQPDERFGRILSQVFRAQLNETITTYDEAVALAGKLIASM